MAETPAYSLARITLRILIVINWLSGVAILALLTATITAEAWTFQALGITPESGIPALIGGLRVIAALGLVAIFLNGQVLVRLLAIVQSAAEGDPFVAANAARLKRIAWTMLAMQGLSLAIAGIGRAISTPANPLHLDAGFSAGGWLAVVLSFVLAHVFAQGTMMRQDLEGTV